MEKLPLTVCISQAIWIKRAPNGRWGGGGGGEGAYQLSDNYDSAVAITTTANCKSEEDVLDRDIKTATGNFSCLDMS